MPQAPQLPVIAVKDLIGKMDRFMDDRIKRLFQLSVDESHDGEISALEAEHAKTWYDRNGDGVFDQEDQAFFVASRLIYNEYVYVSHAAHPDFKFYDYNESRIAEAIKQVRDHSRINIYDYLDKAYNPGVKIYAENLTSYSALIEELDKRGITKFYDPDPRFN